MPLGAVVVGGTATIALHRANADLDTVGTGTEYWLSNVLNGLAWAIPGALIARARPRLPFGWILGGLGVAHVVTATLLEVAVSVEADRLEPTTPGRFGMWLGSWLWVAVPAAVPLLLFRFPTGDLPSPRWKPIWAYGCGAALILVLGAALHPGSLTPDDPDSVLAHLDNPVGVDAGPAQLAYDIGFPLQALAAAAGVASLVVRYRSSDRDVREQVRWLALGAAASVAMTVGTAIVPLPTGVDAPFIILPLTSAITVALLRHRLFAIDHVVRRATAYAALGVLLAAAYAAIVAGGVAVLGSDAGTPVGALAAVVVAVAFAPLRDRLQAGVDRLFYGGRRDPYEVIAGIGRRLGGVDRPEAVLPRVAEELVETLKLPWVAIEVDGVRTVQRGTAPPDVEPEPFVLAHQGAAVGRLLVAPRPGDTAIDDEDRAVLRDLAPQLATAAQAVRLNDALQASRQRLVTAREEERRRLRRDLHDGLGPTLSGVAMRADAAATVLDHDRDAAAGQLQQINEELTVAVQEVRRLVDGLRPAELGDLGLLAALRAQADRLGPATTVDADDLGTLPAAVEVAAYRIVVEAMTNVRRHASATRCQVRLRSVGGLRIEVEDDGIGYDPVGVREGSVGLRSMAERAEELGGSLVVERCPTGGTVVRAHLPIAEAS